MKSDPTRSGPDSGGLHFFLARSEARSTKPLYDPRGVLRGRIERLSRARSRRETVESVLLEAFWDIIEYAGKLQNGQLRKDPYLVRYAAKIIADKSAESLVVLNDLSPFDRRHLWHQVLKARKKPAHLKNDYLVSLGLEPTGDAGRVFSSALRLAGETLRLVRLEYGRKATRRNFRELLKQPLEALGL